MGVYELIFLQTYSIEMSYQKVWGRVTLSLYGEKDGYLKQVVANQDVNSFTPDCTRKYHHIHPT